MKTIYYFFVLAVAYIPAFSQVKFESGYFISNDGKKTSCLVKNADWKNNPTEFVYKISENDQAQTAGIENVAEFGIINFSMYKRFTVDIDQSSEYLGKISDSRLPEFKKEQVFLKMIVQGKANLHAYETADFTRYFISTDTLFPEQLIYKSYKEDANTIGENNGFRNQLWNYLKCESIHLNEIERLNYKESDLVRIFTSYNECTKTGSVKYNNKMKKDLFNFNLRPGINFSGLDISNDVFPLGDKDFGNKINFRLGIEAEIIFPFQRNKWALIAEPVYQYYKYDQQEGTKTTSVNYKSIEVNAGFRHYFFLSDQSKIFLNASVILDLPFNSYIQVEGGTKLDIRNSVNGTIGAGYKFKNRIGAELRYQLNREVLNNYISWSSNYKTFSLVFSYTLF